MPATSETEMADCITRERGKLSIQLREKKEKKEKRSNDCSGAEKFVTIHRAPGRNRIDSRISRRRTDSFFLRLHVGWGGEKDITGIGEEGVN